MMDAGQLLSATHFTMWALMCCEIKKKIVTIVLTGTQGLSVHDESM
jgi:hypothetical protein